MVVLHVSVQFSQHHFLQRLSFPIFYIFGLFVGEWNGMKGWMLKKGMANHFSILACRIPWAVWKAKRYDTERWTRKVSRCSICYWRNNSRKNEEMAPMQKQHPVLDVTGDGSKVWCDKEQYCIGTWNVRSMNQGKLKVVKQEMARVDIDILGIGELK